VKHQLLRTIVKGAHSVEATTHILQHDHRVAIVETHVRPEGIHEYLTDTSIGRHVDLNLRFFGKRRLRLNSAPPVEDIGASRGCEGCHESYLCDH
jgi:hypothetical protein